MNLNASTIINESWLGGYKLTSTIDSPVSDLKFFLPKNKSIRAIYGAELNDLGEGNYLLSSENLLSNEIIFIIDGNSDNIALPQFDLTNAHPQSESTVRVTNPTEVTATPNDEGILPESISETADGDWHDSIPVIDMLQLNESEVINTEEVLTNTTDKFAYGEALQKNFLFLEANRSGDLGPDNRIEWRSDSTVNDGSTVGRDLEGGYFDAGDHVKFGQPMAASVNMLAWGGVEYTDAYKNSGQFDELLDAVKWGTDYFLKAHETSNGKTERLWVQVGEGGAANDHGYWGAPELVEANTTRNAFYIDANNPGSDVAASTSSALAAASMLFRGVDDAYADELLKNATQLYEFAETYQGKYSDSVPQASPFYTSWSGYGDELASGAAWLHKATGTESYLTKAEDYFKNQVGGLKDWSWAVDDHSYGAAVILAQESDDSFFKTQVEGWLDKWIGGNANINYTPGGFAHRADWGSVPVTSSAAYLAQLYNDTVHKDSRYSDFATKQVDYILGDNPAGFSYMVGFGDNYSQRPHHRGSAPNTKDALTPMENILFGAVVGGPDSPDDFAHNDRRDDWITNEVGTSYNAPFASALIQQYDNFGGDTLSEAELDLLPGIDADGRF